MSYIIRWTPYFYLQVQSTISMKVASPSINILSQSQVRATLVVLTFSSYDYQLSSCHKNHFSVSCCMLPPTCCNVCCLVQGSTDPSDSSTSTAHTGEISFCKHCCNKLCTSDLLLLVFPTVRLCLASLCSFRWLITKRVGLARKSQLLATEMTPGQWLQSHRRRWNIGIHSNCLTSQVSLPVQRCRYALVTLCSHYGDVCCRPSHQSRAHAQGPWRRPSAMGSRGAAVIIHLQFFAWTQPHQLSVLLQSMWVVVFRWHSVTFIASTSLL